jgi:hypothetical protein
MLREFALEHVGPGWEVYSTKRFMAGADPDMPLPMGGTVVQVLPPFTELDTGEMTGARYRCLPPWRRDTWHILTAEEVDLDLLAGVNRNACSAGAVRLLRPLFERKRAGLRGRDDVERIHDADRLAHAWAGNR